MHIILYTEGCPAQSGLEESNRNVNTEAWRRKLQIFTQHKDPKKKKKKCNLWPTDM